MAKTMMAVQVETDSFKTFKSKCKPTPYQQMIRELVTAFNEDRVRIIPTENQNRIFKIYENPTNNDKENI